MLKETVLELVGIENGLAQNAMLRHGCELPEKCYFAGKNRVICYPRSTGDSRYPYSCDGFTLWAHSSGYISLNEGAFYYIPAADEGKQPYCAFFGGVRDGNGFFPLSITGAARQANEKNVVRFTVYTPEAVYYITKSADIIFFVRAFVADNKSAVFTVGAINRGKTEEIYLSAYLNCLLMHAAGECNETKWFKSCTAADNGFVFEAVENIDRHTKIFNYGAISRAVNGSIKHAEQTTSRGEYAGGKTNSITVSPALFTGHFDKRQKVCRFGDTAIAGDILIADLKHDDMLTVDYICERKDDRTAAVKAVRKLPANYAEDCFARAERNEKQKSMRKTALKMVFGDMNDGSVSGDNLTEFVNNVMRQVEFCATAKNSGVSLLGVRDVAQQIEAALMWEPEACRKKMLEVLGAIDPCGRPPRQYSAQKSGAPQADTRAFIDQGLWLISTVYTFLAFTDDIGFLDEECGFLKIVGHNRVLPTDEKSDVFDHLVRITDYLIKNIDKDTGCLRALYGDWNDALDGLGISEDANVEFGSGVSVMASLQLYRNLEEMQLIAKTSGRGLDLIDGWQRARAELADGLKKYAIVSDGERRKILHGWTDKREKTVCGFCDPDGKSRDGLTSNAYWIISGAYLWDTSIKTDILRAYENLDSKYGLKTFEPYFAPDAPNVGRIVDLPKGTAENAATYVHATLFGIRSLFLCGESELAWAQIKKILPLTHSLITTTPFIMSNSYVYNEELGLDGESMSDWFTGSSNMLIKTLVWDAFGLLPDLDGLNIAPCKYMPFRSARISLSVKGKRVNLVYDCQDSAMRSISADGKELRTSPHPSSGVPAAYIKTADLKDGMTVFVRD